MKVQQAAVIVSTPVKTQLFKVSRRALDAYNEKWLKVVEQYYEQITNCVVYDPDLI
jgi:hypothetical protein